MLGCVYCKIKIQERLYRGREVEEYDDWKGNALNINVLCAKFISGRGCQKFWQGFPMH